MLRRSFPGRLTSLEPIRALALEAAARAGLDADVSYRVRLAVDEIATNIVTHGYRASGSGTIEVVARLAPEALTIELADCAPPFDPTQQPIPTEEQLSIALDQRADGGLGLYLVTRSVDALRYERDGAKNRTTLTIRRPAGQAP